MIHKQKRIHILIFFLITALFGITATLTSIFKAKRLIQICTETTYGVIYTYPHYRDKLFSAEFKVNGTSYSAKGIQLAFQKGDAVVIHYSPENPAYCYADYPEMVNGRTAGIAVVMSFCTIAESAVIIVKAKKGAYNEHIE